jgi:hypothetical protein
VRSSSIISAWERVPTRSRRVFGMQARPTPKDAEPRRGYGIELTSGPPCAIEDASDRPTPGSARPCVGNPIGCNPMLASWASGMARFIVLTE